MTEEQRKAAIDKAARGIYAAVYHFSPSETERHWSQKSEESKKVYRLDATAALEAVGYFKFKEVSA